MLFKNKAHEVNYHSLLQEMKRTTPNRQAVAYLLALDPICFEHCRELYDFYGGHTIPEGLDKAWHTSASRRTTRLAFNLYNGWCTDGETYIGPDGYEELLPSRFYTPSAFFGCEDAPYYVEAIKIRFPEFWKL